MPLKKSADKSDIGKNIKTLKGEGYDLRQAIAIALNTAREAGADVGKPKAKDKKKN